MQSDCKDKGTKKNKTLCETILSKLIKIRCDKKGAKGEHLSHSAEKKHKTK